MESQENVCDVATGAASRRCGAPYPPGGAGSGPRGAGAEGSPLVVR